MCVGEGGEKHEIYAAAFGSHPFYDLFLQDQWAMASSPPRSATDNVFMIWVKDSSKFAKRIGFKLMDIGQHISCHYLNVELTLILNYENTSHTNSVNQGQNQWPQPVMLLVGLQPYKSKCKDGSLSIAAYQK